MAHTQPSSYRPIPMRARRVLSCWEEGELLIVPYRLVRDSPSTPLPLLLDFTSPPSHNSGITCPASYTDNDAVFTSKRNLYFRSGWSWQMQYRLHTLSSGQSHCPASWDNSAPMSPLASAHCSSPERPFRVRGLVVLLATPSLFDDHGSGFPRQRGLTTVH